MRPKMTMGLLLTAREVGVLRRDPSSWLIDVHGKLALQRKNIDAGIGQHQSADFGIVSGHAAGRRADVQWVFRP